jgi:hypothetical protein
MQLPTRPSLKQLKFQAKDLLDALKKKGVKEQSTAACQRLLASHPQWVDVPAADVDPRKVSLAEAQLVVAREYGFDTWPKLKKHVEWTRGTPAQRISLAVKTVNPIGWTLLPELSDYAENLESLKHMLRQEPQLAQARHTHRQMTLLHTAAWGNGVEMAQALIEAGADVQAKNAGGATPLALALFYGQGRHQLARILASYGPQPDNLRTAAGLGDMQRLASFFDSEGRLRPQAGAGREIFHKAYEAFERPLVEGENALLHEAFMYGSRNGQIEALEFLMAKGAGVNTIAYVGTPLHWAAFFANWKRCASSSGKEPISTPPTRNTAVRRWSGPIFSTMLLWPLV